MWHFLSETWAHNQNFVAESKMCSVVMHLAKHNTNVINIILRISTKPIEQVTDE